MRTEADVGGNATAPLVEGVQVDTVRRFELLLGHFAA